MAQSIGDKGVDSVNPLKESDQCNCVCISSLRWLFVSLCLSLRPPSHGLRHLHICEAKSRPRARARAKDAVHFSAGGRANGWLEPDLSCPSGSDVILRAPVESRWVGKSMRLDVWMSLNSSARQTWCQAP
jgi:hypothetical protein